MIYAPCLKLFLLIFAMVSVAASCENDMKFDTIHNPGWCQISYQVRLNGNFISFSHLNCILVHRRSIRFRVTVENGRYPAIPLDAGQVQGWKDIPLRKDDSLDPLIPLGPLSQEAEILMTSSLYFGEHSNSPYAENRNKLEGSL